LTAELIGDHRAIWYASGLLVAEGHPHPAGKGQLASCDRLPDYVSRMHGAMHAAGIEVPSDPGRFGYSRHGFDGFGRLDLTVDLSTESTAVGLGILAGMAAIQPDTRLQTIVTRQPGGRAVETVTWRGRSGIKARAYDKSTEALSGPRATLLRFEDQRRWPSEHRRDLEDVGSAAAGRAIFAGRFMPLWQASKGVKVVTHVNAAQHLRQAVTEERITPGQAIDVAGYLFLEQADVRVGSRPTRWRHRKLARELGLVLVDGELVEQEVEVDMEDVMTRVLDEGAWNGE
jgi:hypothetical protein